MVASQSASAVPYTPGNVFAGYGNGLIREYTATGTLVQTMNTGTGPANPPGSETGMCWDRNRNLYSTDYSAYDMTKFSNSGTLLTNPWGGAFSFPPEDCVVDAIGDNVFVGTAEANNQLFRFNTAGTLQQTYVPATDTWAIDWIDLAADQSTIFYTSEGAKVKRFNTATNTQLADFATGLPASCFALRIRPNGEVLVACDKQIVRLNASGAIIQSYNPGNVGDWFTLDLDPDGTSFWVAGYTGGQIYKVNIASGAILGSFTVTPFTGTGLSGLNVLGGSSAAAVGNPYQAPQSAQSISTPLVPVFSQCTAPTGLHGGTGIMAVGSCAPSPTGTARIGTQSVGSAALTVVPGNLLTPANDANVSLTANITDVRVGSPTGADYNPNPSGPDMTLVQRFRITDLRNCNGTPSCTSTSSKPATTTENDFAVPVDCVNTASTSIGSTCSASTTANAVAGGYITEGTRTVIGVFRVRVNDAGPDGVRANADDTLFAQQGYFVP
jgi:hypothetical protein